MGLRTLPVGHGPPGSSHGTALVWSTAARSSCPLRLNQAQALDGNPESLTLRPPGSLCPSRWGRLCWVLRWEDTRPRPTGTREGGEGVKRERRGPGSREHKAAEKSERALWGSGDSGGAGAAAGGSGQSWGGEPGPTRGAGGLGPPLPSGTPRSFRIRTPSHVISWPTSGEPSAGVRRWYS